MKEIILAKRYASSAIFNVKEEELSRLLEESKLLLNLLEKEAQAYNFLKSKVASTSAKLDLLSSILQDSPLNDFWSSFFLLLSSKKREAIFTLILKEIIKQLYQKSDIEEIDLYLAFDHDPHTLALIVKEIENKLCHKIAYNLIVKKEIIGGFIAKSESVLIDASISGKLNRFVKHSNTL